MPISNIQIHNIMSTSLKTAIRNTQGNTIVLNKNYNQEFDDPALIRLISQFEKLILGKSFNKSLKNLPEGLRILILSQEYNVLIDTLPTTLTHLIFRNYNKYSHTIQELPIGIEFLHLPNIINFELLPSSLKTLSLQGYSNLDIVNLPNSIKHLILNGYDDIIIHDLPAELEILVINNGSFNVTNLHSFPRSIKHIFLKKNHYKFYQIKAKFNLDDTIKYYHDLDDLYEKFPGIYYRNFMEY